MVSILYGKWSVSFVYSYISGPIAALPHGICCIEVGKLRN